MTDRSPQGHLMRLGGDRNPHVSLERSRETLCDSNHQALKGKERGRRSEWLETLFDPSHHALNCEVTVRMRGESGNAVADPYVSSDDTAQSERAIARSP